MVRAMWLAADMIDADLMLCRASVSSIKRSIAWYPFSSRGVSGVCMSSQEYTDVLSRLDLVSCELFAFSAMLEGHVN